MAISITPAPDLPDLGSPATFNTRAVALLSWIVNDFVGELEAITASDIMDAFSGDLIPTDDETYDIGSPTHKLALLYAATVHATLLNTSAISGVAPTITIYDTSANSFTHNLQSTTRSVEVFMGGPSGGSGGADGSTDSSDGGAGSGGGSGAYAHFIVDAAMLGISSLTLSVGAGGTLGNGATPTDATAGTAPTTYADGTNTVTCGAGQGGKSLSRDAQAQILAGGDGGIFSSSIVSGLTLLEGHNGQDGGAGVLVAADATAAGGGALALGGHGGAHPLGCAGGQQVANGNGEATAGIAATGNCAGPGGAAALGDVTAVNGQNGRPGKIILIERPY